MDIIKAFEKSMGEYDSIQKSKHWKKFDARKHLYTLENLENFRNNKLSDGLDDRYSSGEQKEIFQDLVTELGEEYVLSNLTDKNIGNSPNFFKIDNLYVDGGQNFHIKWLHELETYVFSKRKINYVCEIGGGYGSLAQKIRSKHACKYILIDLPEANLLSSYYLSKLFPDLKFLLCDEIKDKSVGKEDIDRYDFVIIPPWYKIDGVKIDLFINTRSMMEMNFGVIQKYFYFIQTHIVDGGFFLNINRYYKSSVGHPIELSKYPYDEKWQVVSSNPSWKQHDIHQLITERISGLGNIKDELTKIGKMGESFVPKKMSLLSRVWNALFQ
ncbi:MAG: putative sugar O-methyltransferase [bacterium]|nr:putative sugar O-methyltransferase [bacterium]